jgi:hypothetical protein
MTGVTASKVRGCHRRVPAGHTTFPGVRVVPGGERCKHLNMTKLENIDLRALADKTIAEVLAEHYPEARFRAAFLANPVLAEWAVKDVLQSSTSLGIFLGDCRSLPQFGKAQEVRLVAVLMDLHARMGLATLDRKETLPPPDDPAPFPITADFHPDFVSAWRSVYQRAWQRAHFDDFIYIPSSLPEFIKHPDVLRIEVGPDTDLTRYLAENAALRHSLPTLTGGKGLILIDGARVDMILQRRGAYGGLSDAALAEQRDMISDMIAVLPSQITIRVCDIERAGLSGGAVVGDMVTLASMGGYLVTQDARLKALVTARSEKAAAHGLGFADYLKTVLTG